MKKAKRKRSASEVSNNSSPRENLSLQDAVVDSVVKRLSETDAGSVKRRKKNSSADSNDDQNNTLLMSGIVDQTMTDATGNADATGQKDAQKDAKITKAEKKMVERDQISLGGHFWRVEADLRSGLKVRALKY
jgi:hypothetical protein